MMPAPDLTTALVQTVIILAVLWFFGSLVWGTIAAGLRWIDWLAYTGLLLILIAVLSHLK